MKQIITWCSKQKAITVEFTYVRKMRGKKYFAVTTQAVNSNLFSPFCFLFHKQEKRKQEKKKLFLVASEMKRKDRAL